MSRLAFAFTLMASTATAGGMDDMAHAPDPCAPIATEGMTGEMVRGWQAMLEMKADECGPVEPRAFFDRRTGERLSDDEILRRIFDGSDVTPVPVPAAGWLLAGSLAFLALFRRTPRQNPQPAKPRHVPATQDKHWKAKRRYHETHARLAAELGREWKGRG